MPRRMLVTSPVLFVKEWVQRKDVRNCRVEEDEGFYRQDKVGSSNGGKRQRALLLSTDSSMDADILSIGVFAQVALIDRSCWTNLFFEGDEDAGWFPNISRTPIKSLKSTAGFYPFMVWQFNTQKKCRECFRYNLTLKKYLPNIS